MQDVLNATDVRADFSKFIDCVVHEKPRVFRRNRDTIMSFSAQHILDLLSTNQISMEFDKEDDGRYYGSLKQMGDIIGEGDTVEELRRDLAVQLVEYAQDYYDDFTRYYNASNRRSHLPFVLLTLFQDDTEGVVKLIHG